jgi:hypothetical protein
LVTPVTSSEYDAAAATESDQNQHGIAVIGDPGRMLRGIAPGAPPDQPWPADIAASAHQVAGLQVRAASVRGLLHRSPDNIGPRQDAYSLAYEESTGSLVAVVCDGVGSLRQSHEAAAYVCQVLPWKYLARRDWLVAFDEVNAELMELSQTAAKADGQEAMATTVIAVAVEPGEQGYGLRLAAVGDSEAWQLHSGRVWNRLMPPAGDLIDDREITTGTTKALPTDQPVVMERAGVVDGGVFLMTDGIGAPLAMNTEVQDRLALWWAEPPDPFTFARQAGFARRTFVDDRTVVGIWFAPTNTRQAGRTDELAPAERLDK